MAQYVIQIETESGWLAKSFQVTEEYPIPTNIPEGRVQVILTNTDSFNGIVEAYNQYAKAAIFADNPPNIDVSGAVVNSWPID